MATPSTSRWRRFRRNPRAFGSLIALGFLYLVSLFSELVCNAKPLLLRANGRTFLPFIRHVSENDLCGNGVHSSPDFATIAATNPSVHAVFAPIRFGPRTIAKADSLAAYRRVRAVIRPAVRAGRLDLRPDLTISRQDGAEIFFGAVPAAGTKLTDIVTLPESLEAALAARFLHHLHPGRRGNRTLASRVRASPRAAPHRPPATSRRPCRKGHARRHPLRLEGQRACPCPFLPQGLFAA